MCGLVGRRQHSGHRCQVAGDSARRWPYRDALGLQDEAGYVPGRQADADGVSDALHQVGPEGVPGSHLQEEDHPLLPVLVVLGDAEAVFHLLKGFHCRDTERGHTHTAMLASANPTHTANADARPPGWPGTAHLSSQLSQEEPRGGGRDRQKITHMEETERELERELESLTFYKEAKCGPYLLHRLI